jgi:hypothetical protein
VEVAVPTQRAREVQVVQVAADPVPQVQYHLQVLLEHLVQVVAVVEMQMQLVLRVLVGPV